MNNSISFKNISYIGISNMGANHCSRPTYYCPDTCMESDYACFPIETSIYESCLKYIR